MFDPNDWYWIVASLPGQVFSSATGTFLTLPNAAYTTWLGTGEQPSHIHSVSDLYGALQPYPAVWLRALPALVASAGLTLPQQALAVLTFGFTLQSTGTPALNGTYAADLVTQQNIEAEIDSILLNGTFTNGQATMPWSDISGTVHTFNVTQFKAFATAHAAFVTAIDEVVDGVSTTLPSATATIP